MNAGIAVAPQFRFEGHVEHPIRAEEDLDSLLSAGSGQFTSSPLSLKSLLSVWLAACLSLQLYHMYCLSREALLFCCNIMLQFLSDASTDI